MLDIISVKKYDDAYHFNGSGFIVRRLRLLNVEVEHGDKRYVGDFKFIWHIGPEKKHCFGGHFAAHNQKFTRIFKSDLAEEIYNSLDIKFDENVDKLLT